MLTLSRAVAALTTQLCQQRLREHDAIYPFHYLQSQERLFFFCYKNFCLVTNREGIPPKKELYDGIYRQ